MTEQENSLKKYAQVALLAMAALFILGIIFYKQRIYFADASYIAFNMIKNRSWSIIMNRYGSFITQLWTFVSVRLDLPTKWVIKGYALSFNLFYLTAAFVVYRCRKYALVIVMAMYYYLLVTESFYWTNNELHQAVGWMFLFFGITFSLAERKANMFLFLPVFTLLGVLVIYTHFIVLMPLTFLWAFLWIRGEGWPWGTRTSILLTILLAAIVGSKFLLVQGKSYDDNYLHNITHFTLLDIFDAYIAPTTRSFFWRCMTNYWVAICMFVAGLVYFFREGKRWLAVLCIAFLVLYIVPMGITYHDFTGEQSLFHIESEWQSLGIMVGTAFAFGYLPFAKTRNGIFLLTAIFVIRLIFILNASEKFTDRYKIMADIKNQMNRKGIKKLAIISNPDLERRLLMSWGMPDESMLMSAACGDTVHLTYYMINGGDTALLRQMADPKIVCPSFEVAPPSYWVNTRFHPDTLHPYAIMTYDSLMR